MVLDWSCLQMIVTIWVIGWMILHVGKVNIKPKTALSQKAAGSPSCSKAWPPSPTEMAPPTKVISRMTSTMAQVKKFRLMEPDLKAPTILGRSVKEPSTSQTAANTTANSPKTSSQEKVLSPGPTAESTPAPGKITSCTGRVN